MESMKTTVDIPEKTLKEAMKFSKAKTKREAIVKALDEYVRREQVERLISKFGTMDGIMTQEDLRKMREDSDS
jgi:Arc/MetJ family transcription regulator